MILTLASLARLSQQFNKVNRELDFIRIQIHFSLSLTAEIHKLRLPQRDRRLDLWEKMSIKLTKQSCSVEVEFA